MPDRRPENLCVAEQIAATLGESGLPVVVIGAVALAAHRYPRFTEDIDLGILATPAQIKELAASLQCWDPYHFLPGFRLGNPARIRQYPRCRV